jgi:signal peptide peptidase SppA
MTNNPARLLAAFYGAAWAILPDVHASMEQVLLRWAAGVKLDDPDIAAAIGDKPAIHAARRSNTASASGGIIGVLPVYGVIGHRANLVADSSSGINTSTEILQRAFSAMVADSNVRAIVLDIDSPGGSVAGVQELADSIRAARGSKPIVAVANSLAASAAYWIGASADEFVVTPSGEVGSIGVFAAHQDVSKAAEIKGVKTTLISAGKYKTEGNPFEALSGEAQSAMQARVNDYYADFVRAVAQSRNDTQANVRDGYGEGRVLGATKAVRANLVDRIATFDQVITDLGARLSSAAPARAITPTPRRAAAERALTLLD